MKVVPDEILCLVWILKLPPKVVMCHGISRDVNYFSNAKNTIL